MANTQNTGPSSDRVTFTRQSAERIAKTVRIVEGMEPETSPLVFKKAVQESTGGGKAAFRICSFEGAWSKNSTKTLTFAYQTTTPNTVTVMNLFANISVDCGARKCAIAREGTAWFLIAAECP